MLSSRLRRGALSAVLLLAAWMAAAAPAQADQLTLIQDGKSDYRIVVAEDAAPAAHYAAEELALHLGRISGAELPIGHDLGAAGTVIFIGEAPAARTAGFEVDDLQLGPEDYALRRDGGRLAIIGGGPRGTLYGVYALLREDLGVRWYAPDETYIPKTATVTLNAPDRLGGPAFVYREVFFNYMRHPQWAARMGVNGPWGAQTERQGGHFRMAMPQGHTFDWLLNPAEYFDEHPEYFALVNGVRVKERTQLCLTHPEVKRLVTEKVRQWMRDQPEAEVFCIGQNDWFNWCECDACAALDEHENSHAGSLIHFVNHVADAVKDEFPDKRIMTFAYYYTREAPRHVVARDNVIIWYCTIDACHSHPLDACERNVQFREDLEGWAEHARTIFVWDYFISFRHYLQPYPNYRAMGPNMRFYRDHRVEGMFAQGSYHGAGFCELAEMRTYVLARLMWDPSLDDQALIREFAQAYYGPAAEPFLAYLDLLSDEVEATQHHVNWHASTPEGTAWPPRANWPNWSPRAEELFAQWSQPQTHYLREPVMSRAEAIFTQGRQAVGEREPYLTRWRRVEIPVRYIRLLQMEPGDPARPQAVEQFTADALELKMEWISEWDKVDKLGERLKQ